MEDIKQYTLEMEDFDCKKNKKRKPLLSNECERHFIENVESRIIDYVPNNRIGLERN